MGLFKRKPKTNSTSNPGPQPAENVLAQAEEFAARGDYRAAINLLEEAGAEDSSGALARRLIDLRIEAFGATQWPQPGEEWPPQHDNRFAGSDGFPQIDAPALDAAALKAGIIGRGGLIVRGLMQPELVAQMRGNIQRALRARRAFVTDESDGETPAWFYRSPLVRGGPVQLDKDDSNRYTDSGSVWSVDSPRTALALAAFYRQIGLPQILSDYFDEPAVLSVRKWVLRCITPNNGGQAGWHQDGRFLGDPSIRTVNLWIALTDCGTGMKAPGMELVGENDGTIYETGTPGADFEWTVSQAVVDEVAKTHMVEIPTFRAGDAIFFDHFNLHRTAFGTDHTENRYALESWFFAGSKAPEKQQPLVF